MQHSLNICDFLFQKRREKKPPALWDIAEPVSLDEIRAELAILTRKHGKQVTEEFDQQITEHEDLTLEQLWKIFEELEDVDDCQVIY